MMPTPVLDTHGNCCVAQKGVLFDHLGSQRKEGCRDVAFLTFSQYRQLGIWVRKGGHLFNITRAILLRRGTTVACIASEFMSRQQPWHSMVAVGAITMLIGGAAHAQNLDQAKPPAKLFADTCAACHHSARGLSKGRFSLTLFWFLRSHYTSNSDSAWALATYLESVDGSQRGQLRASGAKRPPPAARSTPSSMRPPMPVTGR